MTLKPKVEKVKDKPPTAVDPIPFDDALRRLVNTPPQPRTSKGDKPKEKKPPDG